MKKYSYQILRYQPDRVSEEFLNIGLVVYCAEVRYIRCSVINKIGRVKHLFPAVHSRTFLSKIKLLSGHLNKVGFDWEREFPLNTPSSLVEITKTYLPIDDSALYFTEEKFGLDVDLDIAFLSMYNRIVVGKEPKTETYATDKKVWKNIYKSYFQKYHLDDNLKSRSIKTTGDEIQFDYAVKNGKWNYLEPVTFSLKREDSIKNKVYQWIGKLEELDRSKEDFNLFLLSEMPSDQKLRSFIKSRIDELEYDNFKVEIIEPAIADSFVKKLSDEVHNH